MSDIDGFTSDLEQFLRTGIERQVLVPTLEYASKRIGARAVGTYMKEGFGQQRARVHRGPLRRQSGRLARSLTTRGRIANTGGASEGINRISAAQGRARLVKGSKVPYARIHERGGMVKITRRMRGFFWFKYDQTNDPKWKAMALTQQSHIIIPKRAYLEPALQDEISNVAKFLANKFADEAPA